MSKEADQEEPRQAGPGPLSSYNAYQPPAFQHQPPQHALNLRYELPPLVEAQRQGWITSAQAAAVVVRPTLPPFHSIQNVAQIAELDWCCRDSLHCFVASRRHCLAS